MAAHNTAYGAVTDERKIASDPRMRAMVTAAVMGVLALSLFVFANNALFPSFERGLEVFLGAAGFAAPALVSLALLLSVVVLAGLLRERLLSVAVYVSWAFFIPSVLHFSQIDWTMTLNLNTNLSTMSNALPDAIIFLNGLTIVGAQILLPSYLHLKAVRTDLLRRGAEEEEVRTAARSNLRFTAGILLASLLVTCAAAGAVVAISPLFIAMAEPVAYAYVVLSLAVEGLLIGLFVFYVWRSERPEATAASIVSAWLRRSRAP